MNDTEKYLFTATDPRSYRITLSENQYYNHIVSSVGHEAHTESTPDEIKESIEKPDVIYQDKNHKERNLYFAKPNSKYPSLYLKTVVSIDESSKTGEVITAHLTKHFSGGAEGGLKYVKSKL